MKQTKKERKKAKFTEKKNDNPEVSLAAIYRVKISKKKPRRERKRNLRPKNPVDSSFDVECC